MPRKKKQLKEAGINSEECGRKSLCYSCEHYGVTVCCDAPRCDKWVFELGAVCYPDNPDEELMDLSANCLEYKKIEE